MAHLQETSLAYFNKLRNFNTPSEVLKYKKPDPRPAHPTINPDQLKHISLSHQLNNLSHGPLHLDLFPTEETQSLDTFPRKVRIGMEEGAAPAEGAPAAAPTVDDKKIIHTYPLVKTCDMPEEMWGEVMELIVTGCEKFSYNYELASKLIKQGLDHRFGAPWNIVVGEAYGYDVSYLVGSLMFMYTGVIITMTGLLCHINRVYPIGAKGDELLDCYQANVMSVCFVVAVSLLLSMKELWPSALRSPSRPVLFLYLSMVSAFTVSVCLRMIWLPLTISLTKSNLWIATKIKTTRSLKKSFLMKTVNLLESRFFHKAEMAIVAFAFLGYALKAFGVYDAITRDSREKIDSLRLAKRCIHKSRARVIPRGSDHTLPYVMRNAKHPRKRTPYSPDLF